MPYSDLHGNQGGSYFPMGTRAPDCWRLLCISKYNSHGVRRRCRSAKNIQFFLCKFVLLHD